MDIKYTKKFCQWTSVYISSKEYTFNCSTCYFIQYLVLVFIKDNQLVYPDTDNGRLKMLRFWYSRVDELSVSVQILKNCEKRSFSEEFTVDSNVTGMHCKWRLILQYLPMKEVRAKRLVYENANRAIECGKYFLI